MDNVESADSIVKSNCVESKLAGVENELLEWWKASSLLIETQYSQSRVMSHVTTMQTLSS